MDFTEMREALSVAGCIAANRNEEGFYGARPGAASRAIATATSLEATLRHAAEAAGIGCDSRIAPESKPNPI